MKRVIIRADGSKEIGLGHVMRSVAIGEMLRDDFDCYLATTAPGDFVKVQTAKAGISLIEVPPPTHAAEVPHSSERISFDLDRYLDGSETVVLDGYNFDEKYQQEVKSRCSKLVVIDDFGHGKTHADLVINHAPGLQEDIYQGENYTRYFLGPDYAILRGAFFEPHLSARNPNEIAVCFGGADPYKFGPLVASYLAQEFNINVFLISPHRIRLPKVEALWGVDVQELQRIYSAVEVAVVSASTSLFEALSCRAPTVAGFFVDNQLAIYNGFVKLGCCYPLGRIDQEMGIALNKIGNLAAGNWSEVPQPSDVIDLKSKERITDAFTELCK